MGSMRIKRGLLVLAAMTVAFATTMAFGDGTAFAGKMTGQGSTTCVVGGTITFDPPLTMNGTPNEKRTTAYVTASLNACSGGTPVGSSKGSNVKTIKQNVPKGITPTGAAVLPPQHRRSPSRPL